MRLFELESDNNTVYFAFINSNPPTFGYKRALDTIKDIAKNSDHLVFINPAYDGEMFPLKPEEAIKYNKAIFKNSKFYEKTDIQNPIQALKYISEKYSKVYFLTRDKTVKDFRRMYEYAENWGIESFEIIGLGDSTRPLPTGTSKDAAMDAVMDNDYESFKKTIPSNDNRTISNLFIDLRKAVLDENEVKESTVNVVYEALLALSKHNTMYLNEHVKRDTLDNHVIMVENFIDQLKKFKIVFNNRINSTKVASDNEQNYVIMMNTNTEKLQQYLDLNEKTVKEALQFYVNESITSGNIASTSNLLGNPIKRNIDYSFIKDIKKSNSYNKHLDAVNHVLNTYGYIDKDIVNEIDTKLGYE